MADQLGAPVVGLTHDALPGLGDVVLEADDVFEAERLAELGGDLHASRCRSSCSS